MDDFKLKLILSILGGIVFAFVFIILAFALPINKNNYVKKAPKNKLEKISHALKHKD
jgi:hypothetical protein